MTHLRWPLALFASALVLPAVVHAQNADLDVRVKRLEAQVRALQRSVFPGSKGELFEPEVSTAPGPSTPVGTPATGALVDAQTRVSALETQVANLTDSTERATYAVGQVETRLNALEARIAALEARGTAAPPQPIPNTDRSEDAGETASAVAPPAATPPQSTGRVARVAGVERPSSSDTADDRYVYGYRLWGANLYPEARKELAAVVSAYPKHRRASWAQNLLGRAWLDEGLVAKDNDMLKRAAQAFFDNYQANPDGERAADSVYYLGRSLLALKDKPRACDAFLTFDEVYGPNSTANLRALVAQGKKDAGC